MNRRRFLTTTAAAATLPGALRAQAAPRLSLGYDNFAVRAMGWKAPQLIDFAAAQKVDSLFITDLDAFTSLEEKHLAGLRALATEKNIRLYLGTWSICPSSPSFRDTWGSAEEHLALALRSAKALGSPVIRVVLGSAKDRLTDGGIAARIEDTLKVLASQKSLAEELEVRIAMENHAGDMHSLELKALVEAAGPDYVGVNLDSGNAVWTLETPLQNLENLGPYVLTTSLRDTAVWESENGVTAQWTAMGEGMVDWKRYFQRFAELCPQAPVHIETISGFNRELAVKKDDFWQAWPNGKPAGYEAFRSWAATGEAREAWSAPAEADKDEAQRSYQLGEITRSLAYCRKIGLGQA
ncbi:MAG: sugar phosphate isomerase/epimerase family protein [Verrucomicrobiales bacterium]